jgi:hypothetical protein
MAAISPENDRFLTVKLRKMSYYQTRFEQYPLIIQAIYEQSQLMRLTHISSFYANTSSL